jgi:hypothetical protein
MGKRVYLLTRELLFRSKLASVVTAGGAELTRDAAGSELGVIEIEATGWEERILEFSGRGVPVLAFGSHVHAELLRRARALGAVAVPNSQVEHRLAALLG